MAAVDAVKLQRVKQAYDDLAAALADALPEGCGRASSAVMRLHESRFHAVESFQCCGTKPPLTTRTNGKPFDA